MDSCREKRISAEADCESVPDGEATLRAMIGLVYPLVGGGSTWAHVDIAEDIMLPAARCGFSGLLEVEKLCAVFSVILKRIGNTILSSLADHVAILDGERTLEHFIDAMQQLSYVLAQVYDSSRIEAFRAGLIERLDDEPF